MWMRCSANISIIVDLNSLKVFAAEDALLPIHVLVICNQRFVKHIVREVRENGSQVLEQVDIIAFGCLICSALIVKIPKQRTLKEGRTALRVAVLHVVEDHH